MKKNYIKPMIQEPHSRLNIAIMHTSPRWGIRSNSVDYNDVSTAGNDMKITEGLGDGSMESNQRGGFGSDSGPWESLW